MAINKPSFTVYISIYRFSNYSGILKEQCNTDNHTPGCVYPDDPLPEPMSVKPDPNERVEYTSRIIPHAEPSAVNSSSICREKPRFISHKSRVRYMG